MILSIEKLQTEAMAKTPESLWRELVIKLEGHSLSIDDFGSDPQFFVSLCADLGIPPLDSLKLKNNYFNTNKNHKAPSSANEPTAEVRFF